MINPAENVSLAQDRDAWSLYVFRKSRKAEPLRGLAADLESEIRNFCAGRGSAIDALVRAGEIETGLADAGSPDALLAAQVTDQLAAAALGSPANFAQAVENLHRIAKPCRIVCSYPEGFSYYGLNPLDFADLAVRVQRELSPRVAIVGIRSVGSTLGAVVGAALARANISTSRITIRPEGEPYHRSASFDGSQMMWIQSELQGGAGFLVVDEGPGFSGSTFLSVANALVQAGVPRSRILLFCSRPFQSRAEHPGQVQEWGRFHSHVICYGSNLPAEADRSVGGGVWRELLYDDRLQWPACWTEMERIKHLSVDGQTLFKFEGFGRFGKLAREQARLLGEAQFSPRLLDFENGYARYEFLRWRPMRRSNLDLPLLSRMAQYCAFRTRNFPAPDANPASLLAMAEVNLGLQFGIGNPFFELPVACPVYADCRMQPQEWILSPSGCVLKSDATGHGEGHHLPGPVDIAWDLAGLIVEWELNQSESTALLREYYRISGDDASSRVPPYLLLYSVFRMAFWRMAAASMAGSEEAGRLRAECDRHTEKTNAILQRLRAS